MRAKRTRVLALCVAAAGLLSCQGATERAKGDQPPSPAALDVAAIEEASRTKATVSDDGVVRIGWARTDVAVTIDGMPFKPAAGLGSWAAFTATSRGAMVMGDTVVFQDEVDAAMDAALKGGLAITALHNHFFYDVPPVYFMHIGGRGDPSRLAAAIRGVWEAIRQVRADRAEPAQRFPGPLPTLGKIDARAIEEILGLEATVRDGVVKVSVARKGSMHGAAIGGSMGLTSWAAFSGTDELAALDGDFIMTAAEVQPVLRAMRQADIHVVALHNHMIGEQPAFYFTHYWRTGPAAELARAFKSVLAAQERVR